MEDGTSDTSASESIERGEGDRGVVDMIELDLPRWTSCCGNAHLALAISCARIQPFLFELRYSNT
jgi:hypothetical protein